MSVLIFHPSVAPFVQQAARALLEAGELDCFVTTIRDNPEAPLQRLLCGAASLLGRDLRTQFGRRAVSGIPRDKIITHPLGEILRLASGKFDKEGRLTDLVWEQAEGAFDRRVARKLRRGLGGVYGFEYSSLATFRRARELGVPVIYDVPAPEPVYVQQLLEREMDRFPELRTDYHRHTAAREDRRTERRREEWHSASLVIAASKMTKASYGNAGLDTGKVRIVPYGAPEPAEDAGSPGEKPAFLWAGTFSIRKGAHYLVEAWRQGNFGRHARLKVFGAVDLPDRVLRPLPEGVELGGSIPRSELMEHYRQADALLFPTLCDGFGMVVTEAWSRGLPVITTEQAGASDLLKPEINGLLVQPGSADSVKEILDWCLSHRSALHAMREGALATAASWQWSDYRRALWQAVAPALNQPGHV